LFAKGALSLGSITLNLDGPFVEGMMTLLDATHSVTNLSAFSFADITVGGKEVTWDDDAWVGGGIRFKVNYSADAITLNIVEVIPEPGTWALIIGGLGALTLLRRRKVI